MFHIVHSPRFALLAPLKLTFGIGTSDQRFGYSSPVVYTDPVELLTDSSGGNRRVEVHIYSAVIWAAVVLCFLDTIQVST